MELPEPISAQKFADSVGGTLYGDGSLHIRGANEIHKVRTGDVTFVDHEKYYRRSLESEASVILIDQKEEVPEGKAIIVVEDPFRAYDDLVKKHRPLPVLRESVSAEAEIHSSAVIEPGVVIGDHVSIGAHSHIQANTVLHDYVTIGKNVRIQAGSILGTDAYYFKKKDNGSYEKWTTGGRVVIADEVDIGAGCTINRGVSGDTIIGRGSKLDCQVHLGHGVVIGKHCLLAGQVGIGGKTIVEDKVIIYGQVGIAQSLHIGEEAVILAKSGVSKDLEGGNTYFGSPAGEVREKYRELATLRNMMQK